ncbi:unnamed protein product, partial [Closterium sp. Naga37s-1]
MRGGRGRRCARRRAAERVSEAERQAREEVAELEEQIEQVCRRHSSWKVECARRCARRWPLPVMDEVPSPGEMHQWGGGGEVVVGRGEGGEGRAQWGVGQVGRGRRSGEGSTLEASQKLQVSAVLPSLHALPAPITARLPCRRFALQHCCGDRQARQAGGVGVGGQWDGGVNNVHGAQSREGGRGAADSVDFPGPLKYHTVAPQLMQLKVLEQHSTAKGDGLAARLATALAARLETVKQRLVENQAEEAKLREEVKKKAAQAEQLLAVSKDLEERRAAEAQLREEVKEKAAQLQALSKDPFPPAPIAARTPAHSCAHSCSQASHMARCAAVLRGRQGGHTRGESALPTVSATRCMGEGRVHGVREGRVAWLRCMVHGVRGALPAHGVPLLEARVEPMLPPPSFPSIAITAAPRAAATAHTPHSRALLALRILRPAPPPATYAGAKAGCTGTGTGASAGDMLTCRHGEPSQCACGVVWARAARADLHPATLWVMATPMSSSCPSPPSPFPSLTIVLARPPCLSRRDVNWRRSNQEAMSVKTCPLSPLSSLTPLPSTNTPDSIPPGTLRFTAAATHTPTSPAVASPQHEARRKALAHKVLSPPPPNHRLSSINSTVMSCICLHVPLSPPSATKGTAFLGMAWHDSPSIRAHPLHLSLSSRPPAHPPTRPTHLPACPPCSPSSSASAPPRPPCPCRHGVALLEARVEPMLPPPSFPSTAITAAPHAASTAHTPHSRTLLRSPVAMARRGMCLWCGVGESRSRGLTLHPATLWVMARPMGPKLRWGMRVGAR